MGGNTRRRLTARGKDDPSAGSAGTASWGELPREIVAMIASYTCPPVQPLPFTCLTHNTDPDSTAYHRQEDRSFNGPGAQFTSFGSPPQREQSDRPTGQSGSSGVGPSSAAAAARPSSGANASADASEGVVAAADCGIAGSAVPGTFRPSRMSETALAMRCVCRLWCEVLGEGVRRVLLQGPHSFTLCASHFPHISHLGLGTCNDLTVRLDEPAVQASPPRPRRGTSGGGDDDQPGPGPSSTAAAAAADRRRGARSARGGSNGSDGSAATAHGRKMRSLAALRSLRNLQITDTSAHLDLAGSCPHLEELVVWTHTMHSQYGTHTGRDPLLHGNGNVLMAAAHQQQNLQYSGGGRRLGGGSGAAAAAGGACGAATITARRSALDRTLSSLPRLRRLRLSGIDASAARLGVALAGLTGLTSLRLNQCRLPTFIGAPERARSGHSSYGRELIMNLGAKLQDLSLQGCSIRALPEEVLPGLTGLRLLDLSANWLHSLPHTITLLARLEYLDLQHNTLSFLPEGLGALSRLVDLDLSGNYLHRLPPDFGGLTALTHLHLGGLHGLDMGFCWPILAALTNLHSLGLCDVDLSEEVGAPEGGGPGLDGPGPGGAAPWHGPLHALVSALAPAGRLRELMLDGCGLDNLPSCFSELSALSHLSLMENFNAMGLPDAITSLRGLAVLRLGYLDLSRPLPPGLFELGGLRELDLEQNFLPVLSHDISRLTNLQVLNLLDAFDPDAPPDRLVPWKALYTLTRLRQLSVAGSEPVGPRLVRGISALSGLEVLQLHCVTMSAAVLDELISHLRGLACLDLSSCGIVTLPPSITRLPHLTDLHLVRNRINRLPAGFGALTRLVELGLSANPLHALPADITRLLRLRSLSWTPNAVGEHQRAAVSTSASHGGGGGGRGSSPPSSELMAWLARLPDLALHGDHNFAELAKSYGIPWPHRSGY